MLENRAPPSPLGAPDHLVPVNNDVVPVAAAETEEWLPAADRLITSQMGGDAMRGKDRDDRCVDPTVQSRRVRYQGMCGRQRARIGDLVVVDNCSAAGQPAHNRQVHELGVEIHLPGGLEVTE